MKNTYTHLPTGKKCEILRVDGDRSFCNFGDAADPFTFVDNAELRPDFLPEVAYVEHPVNGETVLVRRGCDGFFETRFSAGDPNVLNARMNVTPELAAAMLAGSMFGWTCGAVRQVGGI